jgi:hypothetical protein
MRSFWSRLILIADSARAWSENCLARWKQVLCEVYESLLYPGRGVRISLNAIYLTKVKPLINIMSRLIIVATLITDIRILWIIHLFPFFPRCEGILRYLIHMNKRKTLLNCFTSDYISPDFFNKSSTRELKIPALYRRINFLLYENSYQLPSQVSL